MFAAFKPECPEEFLTDIWAQSLPAVKNVIMGSRFKKSIFCFSPKRLALVAFEVQVVFPVCGRGRRMLALH